MKKPKISSITEAKGGTLTLKNLEKLYKKVEKCNDVPNNEIWLIDERNFRWKKPRTIPIYSFNLFGYRIEIWKN